VVPGVHVRLLSTSVPQPGVEIEEGGLVNP
jgi:hypothetical protein